MRYWVFMLCLIAMGCTQQPDRLTVFGAASLVEALESLAREYEGEHPGQSVVVSVGASSTLARQIRQGAPADVFFSASPEWTAYLGDVLGPVQTVARNRLVVIALKEVPLWTGLDEIEEVERLALADPSHVPAGQYARQILEAEGVWEDAEARTVALSDVRAAARAVALGQADAALVYRSDVASFPAVHVVFEPAQQPNMVVVGAVVRASSQPDQAQAFLDFVQGRTLVSFGFRPIAN